MNKYVLIIACLLCISGVKAEQRYFSTPQSAVDELVVNVKANDESKLLQVLGAQAKPIVESGDSVENEANRQQFLKAYTENNTLHKVSDTQYQLVVGKDNWEFPIPLLKNVKGWYFDTKAGKQEILKRRIGRNELSTMNALLAYVDAQREYYLKNPEHGKTNAYAQKLISSPNKRDGLYYPVQTGEAPSPLGEFFAKASAAGYRHSKSGPQPYLGYYYRILNGQGKAAEGGAFHYLVNGQFISGHALIAWPAAYGNSGIMTFIVNQDGMIYEKNLGAKTPEVVNKITQFNPDKSWQQVKTP